MLKLNKSSPAKTRLSSPLGSQGNAFAVIDNRIAYHQAGHAVAIYVGNKQKKLPTLRFSIAIKQNGWVRKRSDKFMRLPRKPVANVEGGRLIQNLLLSLKDTSARPKKDIKAFEADICNLLVGPLAEAKYLTLCNGEAFSANPDNIAVLRFFGGSEDLVLISEYLDSLKLYNKQERNELLKKCYLSAFNFVNDHTHWHAITALANFILNQSQSPTVIEYKDVVALVKSRLVA